KPVFDVEIKKTEGGALIEISADVFAKGVYVDFVNCDPKLSTNFFDIVNGKKYQIHAETDVDVSVLKDNIILKSVYDIGR
ncbi:MAG: hypothetical protein IKC74_02250, partial [Clostridia bacterium]|nr:hypothetical protein [Clostridia bacterium]